MARKSEAGFWLVDRGEAQWLAWREWLTNELGRRFFPDDLPPVPSEWPPTTIDAATAVADYFRELREQARKDKDWPKVKAAPPPIPIVPTPWVRWSEFEQAERVRLFRDREFDWMVQDSPERSERLAEVLSDLAASMKVEQPQSPALGETPAVQQMREEELRAHRKANLDQRMQQRHN